MKFHRVTIVFIVLSFNALSIHSAERVVANGNPPLTAEMVRKSAGFYAWLLDVRFTPVQQQEYEALLAKEWSREENRKSTLALLQNVDRLDSVSVEKRRQVRDVLLASMLDHMRKNSDEDSRWLLAIYQAAHPQVDAAPTLTPTRSGFDSGPLVGKWRDTSSSAVQYQNSATGAFAPTNGHSFFYQFLPDGTYEYNALVQINSYGCGMQVYSTESGRYRTEGDHLIVQPENGRVRTQQNCGPTGTTEKPADIEKHEHIFHFETDSWGGVTLVMNGIKRDTRPNYFRAEK